MRNFIGIAVYYNRYKANDCAIKIRVFDSLEKYNSWVPGVLYKYGETKMDKFKFKTVDSFIKFYTKKKGETPSEKLIKGLRNDLMESKRQKVDQIKKLVSLIESKTGKKVKFEDKKVLKEMPYVPYQGGGGPEKDQKAENTLVLFQKLQKAGIPCKMDNGQYAKKIWDGDEKMIVMSKGGRNVYISYDRWGFVADRLPQQYNVDQTSLEYTFKALVAWYTGKKIVESKQQKIFEVKRIVNLIQKETGKKVIFKEAFHDEKWGPDGQKVPSEEKGEAEGNKIVDELQSIITLLQSIEPKLNFWGETGNRDDVSKAIKINKSKIISAVQNSIQKINKLIQEETQHSDDTQVIGEDVDMDIDQITTEPDVVDKLNQKKININLVDKNRNNSSSTSTVSTIGV